MPAPNYFLAIRAHQEPAIERLETFGIDARGMVKRQKNELTKKDLQKYNLEELEEIENLSAILALTTQLAWKLFRMNEKENEFGKAPHLFYNKEEKTIEIKESKIGDFLDAIKKLLTN